MIEAPEPTPLDLPQGDADGLEDVVEDVAGAAYWLTVLASDLTGPAASAPGWLGADAAAAAAQVGAVAGLARECSHAVGAAAHRLRLHHDLLVDVRRQVRALREEQQDDFRVMWQRLSRIEDPQLAVMVDAPERVAAIEEVRAGEASRRRRHAALLEELADDAAATAGVLAESSRLVGGRGTRGDGDRVLAHLAAELPGWGERELAARGADLAHDLMHESLTSATLDDLVRRRLLLAGSPAFANALVESLGREGVALLLNTLGSNFLGGESPVAQLLAVAFGAAVPGDGRSRIDEILNATYVRADDRYGEASYIAAGMALVMAAGAAMPSGGPRPATVAGWARQMLLREHEQDLITGIGAVPGDWPPGTGDPVAMAIGVLAQRVDPGTAAALLAEREVWEQLLSRLWADGGTSLTTVVSQAAGEPGAVGAQAVRTGLEVIGSGLPAADPIHWTVNRSTVATVLPMLASGLAGHVTVVTDVLASGIDGDLGEQAEHLMRGLAYLTVDERAVRTVTAALDEWALRQSVPADPSWNPSPSPTVVVPSAFLAVREYGQRLDHALHGFEMKAEAERREAGWDWLIGPYTWFAGVGVGLAHAYGAGLVGADGVWDNGVDEGLRFDREDAAAAALRGTPGDPVVRQIVADQARAVFDRTHETLGTPRPPTPPDVDLADPAKDVAVDEIRDQLIKAGWKGLAARFG